jgi:hypothetical protein
MSGRQERVASLHKQRGIRPSTIMTRSRTGTSQQDGRRSEDLSSFQPYFAALPLQNSRILQTEHERRLPGPML